MSTRQLALFVVAAVSLGSNALAQTAEPRMLRGLVVDAETDVPIEAYVQLEQGSRRVVISTHRTEVTGQFALPLIDVPLTVIAWAPRYGPARVDPTVEEEFVVIRLEREARVSARVSGPHGEVIEGTVRLKPLSVRGSPFGIEATITGGQVHLRGIAPGTVYQVTVSTEGCSNGRAGTLLADAGERRENHVFEVSCP